MGVQGNNYAKWSEQELRKAESMADRFLQENGDQIHENFRSKVEALTDLVESLETANLTFDERLDCFARIAEVSAALQEDAQGFFGLASEPVVARILADVRGKRLR
jgi:exonuclease VII small subunit